MRNRLAFALTIIVGFSLVATWMLFHNRPIVSAATGTTATRINASASAGEKPADQRLNGAYRFESGGWTYVHLQGAPEAVGYQNGYLLAKEIQDLLASVKLEDTHITDRNWDFFRGAAHKMLWPHIDAEYQQELTGIVEGAKAGGAKLDIDDLVAMNAFEELPGYYVPWLNAKEHVAQAPNIHAPWNCSAFVATGSWTKDHKIVIAHNNWTSYLQGERWRVMYDIVPEHGYRIIMDGLPGVIVSDDDFGISSAGLMVTETTMSGFRGWDPDGKPEFVRARKALQYANSIDEYVKIMLDGNNGGYANDWLLGDRKTGEIAQFEDGLKATRVWKSKDGVFVGSNFVSDPEVLAKDTDWDNKDRSASPNARHMRWNELMKVNKGRIDVEVAEQMLSDHHDTYTGKDGPSGRTLCGHMDADPAGSKAWDVPPHEPMGAVQAKVSDSDMAEKMTLVGRVGHPCGGDFKAVAFLKTHAEFSWQAPSLHDMDAGPWTTFRAGEKASK